MQETVIVMETTGGGHPVAFAMVDLSAGLLEKVRLAKKMLEEAQMDWAACRWNVLWDARSAVPRGEPDLFVSRTGWFWFQDTVKGSDETVETMMLRIDWLEKMLAGQLPELGSCGHALRDRDVVFLCRSGGRQGAEKLREEYQEALQAEALG